MLVSTLMKAGFFGGGLFILVAVHGMNEPSRIDPPKSTTEIINPAIKHLQAFDSSFIYLNDLPDSILAELPKINLNSQAGNFVKSYIKKNNEDLSAIRSRSESYFTK